MPEEKQEFNIGTDNKPRQLRIYRANKDLKGYASKWELSFKNDRKYDKWIFFLTMAPQTGYDENGNGQFDWDNQSINVKLGDIDLGEIIAVLDGRKDSVGYKGSLYHESPKGGNKMVKFDFFEGNYKLSVSAQDAEKNKIGQYYQTISPAEAAILNVLLKQAIVRIYGW